MLSIIKIYTIMTAFSQPKDLYKVFFNTKYRDLNIFEELLVEDSISVSFYEITSITIDSAPDDIWCYEIYLSSKPKITALKKQILNFAHNNNILVVDNSIQVIKIVDRDWVTFYQSQLKPIEIGSFFIGARAHEDLCPNNKSGIFIEATRAFGTGQHETTAGCVQALESLLPKQFYHILDIGTGTGILAFVSEILWPQAKILACDIDTVSVEIAKNNAEYNNSRVIIYQNTEEELLLPNQPSKFDLIISNILMKPLIELADEIKLIAEPGCNLVLAGFLDYQQDDLIAAYQKNGFIVKHTLNNNSWIILIMQYTRA